MLLIIAFPCRSYFCEATFFIQGLLTVTSIVTDEENNVSNPISFGGQYIADFFGDSAVFRKLNDNHRHLWMFKHFIELYMPFTFFVLIPF